MWQFFLNKLLALILVFPLRVLIIIFLDIKLAEATKIATDDRLVDIEEEINDIGGKMNLRSNI